MEHWRQFHPAMSTSVAIFRKNSKNQWGPQISTIQAFHPGHTQYPEHERQQIVELVQENSKLRIILLQLI